jgi:uncharacterized membrane protein
MQAINWILVGLLIAALIADTVTDGIETGQRGGKIYPDNTPPLGPHHWNLPTVKGYQNSEPTIKHVSVTCFPTQLRCFLGTGVFSKMDCGIINFCPSIGWITNAMWILLAIFVIITVVVVMMRLSGSRRCPYCSGTLTRDGSYRCKDCDNIDW